MCMLVKLVNLIPACPLKQVVMFHVLPHLLRENGAGEGKPTVEVQGFMPISRLGGNTYARLGSVFDIPRPRVQK